MKLHLPKGLRKAVMACIAAMGCAASTCATGTFIAGAATFSLAMPQAWAEAPTATDTYENSSGTEVNPGSYTADQVLAFKSTACWITAGGNFTCPLVIYQMTITGANNGVSYTFTGDIYSPTDGLGDYNGAIEYYQSDNGQRNPSFNFNGSMVEFTGAITMGNTYIGTINLNNNTGTGALSAVSATVNIGGSQIAEGAAQTISNSSVTSKNLTVSSTKTTVFTGAVTTTNATTLQAGSNVTLQGQGNSLASLSIASGATLTNAGSLALQGTVQLLSAIVNNGTLTLAENIVFDLSGMTAVDGVYTLFTGTAAVDLTSLNGDASSHITGILVDGSNWTFNNNGTLKQVVYANSLTWEGGALVLQSGAQLSGGNFADGDIVAFTTADADVTLGGAVRLSQMTVDAGINVTLHGNSAVLTTGSLVLNGTLTLADADAIDNSVTVASGSAGSLILDWGSATQGTMADLPQTGENQCSLPITIRSGSLTAAAGETYGALAVEAGAGLRVTGAASLNGAISISGEGGWLQDGAQVDAALVVEENVSVGSAFTVAADAALSVATEKTLTLSGTMAVQGDLTVRGGGTLLLSGSGTGSGTMEIDGNSTVQYGLSQDSTNTLGFSTVVVNDGSTFKLEHHSMDAAVADIVLKGGSLYSYDASPDNDDTTYTAFGKLDVQKTSTIKYGWNGGLSFEILTGSADLSFSTEYNEIHLTKFASIENYNGTITATGLYQHTLAIGTVDQSQGMVLNINGDVSSDSFSKLGLGELHINGTLNATGVLGMNYEGTCEISSYSVAYDTVLSYSSAAGQLLTLSVDSLVANDAGAKHVLLDLFSIDAETLKNGIDLGITGGLELSQIGVLGVDSSSLTLTTNDAGHAVLSSTEAPTTAWDPNWGGSVLSEAPGMDGTSNSALATASLTETTGLYNNNSYDTGTVTAVELTGSGGSAAIIYGGDNTATDNAGNGTVTRDSWILAKEGTYLGIVGGNYAQNWNGGTAMNFAGDSHILVDGATVSTLIGGNFKDGKNAQFTGDTYISVLSGEVTGAIIGAGLVCHSAAPVQQGDTHIFIYKPLSDSSGEKLGSGLYYASDMVTGGFVWGTNTSKGPTLNGNTHIALDLSDYSGDSTATMTKHLIGGNTHTDDESANNRNRYTQTLNGDTSVTVDLYSDALGQSLGMGDARKIIGGSWEQYGTSVHNGNTSVTLNGGSFVSSNDNDSTKRLVIAGGSYLTGTAVASSITGVSSVVINGGSVLGCDAVGGDYNEIGASSDIAATSVTLNDGTVNRNLIGGSYVGSYGTLVLVGSSEVNVNGGSVTWTTIGGHYINGTGVANINAKLDGIVVNIDGGTVADVSGGSYSVRNKSTEAAASQSITQGDITVNLISGSVTGDVYAAGEQRGSLGMTTANTTVNVSKDVVLASGKSVNGGYMVGSGVDYASSVTGTRTLAFTDAAEYTNVEGVNFRDFDVVSVADGGSVALGGITSSNEELGTLTKTGGGTLVFNGVTQGGSGILVSEGSLSVSGANSLTSLTVAKDASLATADGASVGSALTLQAGANVSLGESGLGLGSNILTLSGVSTLTLASIPEVVTSSDTFTLFTGVSDVIGLSGGSISGDLQGEGVALGNYFTNDAWNSQYFGDAKLKLVDSSLVITFESLSTPDWTWNGDSNDVWSDTSADNWDATSGTPAAQAVYFVGKGDGDVEIEGQVTPASIEVWAGSYRFVQGTVNDGDPSGIKLGEGGSLTLTGNASVTLALANAELGGSAKLDGGTLTIGDAAALGTGSAATSLYFNGGTLAYADGITVDVSSQINTSSTGIVKVDTGANDVTWADAAGNRIAFANGIEKQGSGSLTLTWSGVSQETISGVITVKAGELRISSTSGNYPTYHFTNAINVESLDSIFSIGVARAHDTTSIVTVSGNLSGLGTVELGGESPAVNYPGGGYYSVSGDNSGFEGMLRLVGGGANNNWNRVVFTDANAIGGANSTLSLAGRNWQINATGTVEIAAKIVVEEGTENRMNGYSSTIYRFNNTLSGSGTLTFLFGSNEGKMIEAAGDMSGFTGTLNLGSGGSHPIFVVSNGAGVNDAATINGSTTGSDAAVLRMAIEGDTTLGAALTGNLDLEHSGSGVLTLSGTQNTATGKISAASGKEVKLGVSGSTDKAVWAGSSLEGGGTLTLVNGVLSNGITSKTGTLNVTTLAATDTVDAGGTDGSLFDSITLAGGTSLTNVAGNITVGTGTSLSLTLTEANIGKADASGQVVTAATSFMIGQDSSGTLDFAGNQNVTLDLTAQAVIELISQHKQDNAKTLLGITTGSLSGDVGNITFNPILTQLGVRAIGFNDGYVVLSGLVEGDWYDTANLPHNVNDYATLGLYKGVLIQGGDTLTLSLDGAPADGNPAEIHILIGAEDSSLVVQNTGEGIAEVSIGAGSDVDSLMEGSILATGEGDNTILLLKEGEHTLTLGSGDDSSSSTASLKADALAIHGGSVVLNSGNAQAAEGNEIGSLLLAGEQQQVGLALGKDDYLAVDQLQDSDAGGTITLGEGSLLDLSGESSLSQSSISGPGALRLGGSLELTDNADLEGVSLEITKTGKLGLSAQGASEVDTLSGEGSIVGNGSSGLNINNTADAVFSGSLTGTSSGNLMYIDKGTGKQTFANLSSDGTWSITSSGDTVFDFRQGEGNSQLTLDKLTLGADSGTTFVMNGNGGNVSVLTLNNIEIQEGASVTLDVKGSYAFNEGLVELGTIADGTDSSVASDRIALTLEGASAFSHLDHNLSYISLIGGKLVLVAVEAVENKLMEYAESHNAQAGAGILWESSFEAGGVVEDVYNELSNMLADGQVGEANRVMAAVAGSSIATLGSAFSADVERQLRAIRNRTTTMGVNQCQTNEDMPYVNAWVNAEGDYRKMDADGTASGYTLNSWGGTLGFDVDCTPHLTLGVALTAMYGDLTASGADSAEGDMDTYYVSLFARYASRAWTHTFVGTVGRADVSLDRTVRYGSSSYATSGDTEGLGFGLMYEVGYVVPLDEDASVCLQPVLNVTWRYAGIDSYSETGNDAALHADSQEMNTVSFGLGARLQAAVGQNLYNRTSIFETRALLKVDAGDRRSDVDVAFANSSAKGNVESAELGAVGAEIGAGLTIPVGVDSGALFMDASLELRSGYTNVNGVVGYRINF